MGNRYLGQTTDYEEPSKLQQVMSILRNIGQTGMRAGAAMQDPAFFEKEKQNQFNQGMKEREIGLKEDAYGLDKQMLDLKKQELYHKQASKGAEMPELASKIRGELQPQTKIMQEVDSAYRKVQSSAKNPSAAGDLSLIFNYMKMLDPGSTVREGEFATAQNTAGIPERLRNVYNKAINGERLSDTQRADFVTQAKNTYNAQYESYEGLRGGYRDMASRYGLNPADVFMYNKIPEEAGQQTPTGQPASIGNALSRIMAPKEAFAGEITNYDNLSDDELYKLWKQKKGNK